MRQRAVASSHCLRFHCTLRDGECSRTLNGCVTSSPMTLSITGSSTRRPPPPEHQLSGFLYRIYMTFAGSYPLSLHLHATFAASRRHHTIFHSLIVWYSSSWRRAEDATIRKLLKCVAVTSRGTAHAIRASCDSRLHCDRPAPYHYESIQSVRCCPVRAPVHSMQKGDDINVECKHHRDTFLRPGLNFELAGSLLTTLPFYFATPLPSLSYPKV